MAPPTLQLASDQQVRNTASDRSPTATQVIAGSTMDGKQYDK